MDAGKHPPAGTPQRYAFAHLTTGASGRRELGETTRHLLAVAFAVAWLACVMVAPVPADDLAYPAWALPVDLAALGTIVLAVGAFWRGSRHAPRLGVAAGVLMVLETGISPHAGDTPLGWWTGVQAGLSLFVLLTSTALAARRTR